jgi:hypothetical protein
MQSSGAHAKNRDQLALDGEFTSFAKRDAIDRPKVDDHGDGACFIMVGRCRLHESGQNVSLGFPFQKRFVIGSRNRVAAQSPNVFSI